MSYRLRLIITISLLIAWVFSIGGTILICASFSGSLDKETEAALNTFDSIQNTLYLVNSMGDRTGYESLEETLSRMQQGAYRWQSLSLETEERIIFQSESAALRDYALPDPPENRCSYLQVNDRHGYGFLIKSCLDAGSEKLTLKARFDLTPVYTARADQQRLFLKVYIVVVLCGIGISALLSFALTRPLRRLTSAVRRISGGDLSTRSRISSADEFGQLSRDFDAMADKLQENILRLESEMQRQEQFMGAFAHELKTPMTSIIGFSDLLRQGNLDENTRMMAADYIWSEGHRLEKLSFKLLDLLLLKKDTVTMHRVWLSHYLGEVERAMAPVMKKRGIRLICKAEQKLVLLEPDLVKSLLYNLIDNASKAMDGEGLIGVMAVGIPGGCQFQVVDNGRGMEPGELSRITEAFYRVDKARSRSQGGAGLGLALCKQIVELHGGSLHYDSAPGKGTRVTVTLYGKEVAE